MKEKRVLFSAVATETSSKKYVSDEKVGKICGENCYEHERYASFQDIIFLFFLKRWKVFTENWMWVKGGLKEEVSKIKEVFITSCV